ncbi:MAG: HDOD domain-containing protein [Calditerrivibrio sp.]|nr:HDOD domain-containing protein [Calditerrivibrio sp.]
MNDTDKIKTILSDITELPPMPQVAAQVLQIIEKPDFSFADLVAVISKDMSITAAILKLANSPLFGLKVTIQNLTQAISLLGINNLKNLVIALSTKGLFEASKITFFEQKLWEHSVATAIYARLFSIKYHRSIAEEAFIIGLLHDIGQVVLSMYVQKYSLVKELSYAQEVDISQLEKEYLGVDHSMVGSYLLKEWGLPELYIDVVRNHHSVSTSYYQDMAKVIYIANNMVKRYGFSITAGYDKGFDEWYSSLGYPEEEITELEMFFHEIIQSEKEMLKL